VEKAASSKRRVRRLAIAGVVWAFVVFSVAGFFVPRGRGRLPDLSATRSPSYLDARFARVVSVVAGRGAAVRCWSHEDWRKQAAERARRYHTTTLGPWAAFTSFSPYLAVDLSPEICIELSRVVLLRRPVWEDEWRDALALSVGTLAHESVHVTGNLSEALAECWGMQAIPTAAVELGRSRQEGRFLAELYWRRWYRFRHRPYWSSECHNGGALDLRPGTDSWPKAIGVDDELRRSGARPTTSVSPSIASIRTTSPVAAPSSQRARQSSP
jgi:hypothetical protein